MEYTVTLSLKDGANWKHCVLYIEDRQRLSDVMNDERKFLPVYRPDVGKNGRTMIVNKDIISMISEEK